MAEKHILPESGTAAPPAAQLATRPVSGRPRDAVVDEVASARERLREVALAQLGVTGAQQDAPSLREGLKTSGAGWYAMTALGVLVVVDQFQAFAFLVLGPEVSEALGIGKSTLAALLSLKTLAFTLAALPMAAYVQKHARRALISVVTGFAWGVMTLFTGFVTTVWQMLIVLVGDGASNGSVRSVHPPLLMDSYPPNVRMRVLSFYEGSNAAGNVIAPLMVAVLTGILGFTWRGVFLAMGVVSIAAVFFAIRLRDPGFGRFDTDRVRDVVRREVGSTVGQPEDADVDLGFFEIVRRLLLIPTIKRILVAHAALGMLLIPLNTYVFFFLEERWGMGPAERSLFFAFMPLFSIAALGIWGRRGERMFTTDPARVVRFTALFLASDVLALAFAIFSPYFAMMVAFFGIAFAAFSLLIPSLNLSMLSIVPPRMRPHAAALAGIFLAAVGGFGGLVLLAGVDSRFGTAGAIASLAIPGITAALILRSASSTIEDDLDRLVDEIVEEEELRSLSARGASLPMLSCRHIDFSYGSLQVLFDVDFTVDDGEMVALLGTNGAGKSTLLRVISGLGLPTRGGVHFRGHDITYLDAERRVQLGITQVPGGRAVCGSLSVYDNLKLFGYSHRRDRTAVTAGIDATFEAFPRLHERRSQSAATLSGGEQQMLGLGKAFMLKPRLLLIDELSLGLAPKVVTELLEMVRRINHSGTAVVLVEQSVNIALSLVDHAYFMEKGEIRFDGAADELLARSDLLRSVFLEGAAQGLE